MTFLGGYVSSLEGIYCPKMVVHLSFDHGKQVKHHLKTNPKNEKKELLVWSTPRTQDASGVGICWDFPTVCTCHPGGLLASNFCNDVFFTTKNTSHEERLFEVEKPEQVDKN